MLAQYAHILLFIYCLNRIEGATERYESKKSVNLFKQNVLNRNHSRRYPRQVENAGTKGWFNNSDLGKVWLFSRFRPREICDRPKIFVQNLRPLKFLYKISDPQK